MYLLDDEGFLEYIYRGYVATGHSDRYTFFLGCLRSKSWFRQIAIKVLSDNPKDKDGGGKVIGGWGTGRKLMDTVLFHEQLAGRKLWIYYIKLGLFMIFHS